MVEIVVDDKKYKDLSGDLRKMLQTAIAEAIENYERRLIVLAGYKNQTKILSDIVKVYSENILNFLTKVKVLYVLESEEGEWLDRFKNFMSEFEKNKIENVKISRITYKQSDKVMGRTYDLLILDMLKSLTPDDIGRLIGTVRGGGLIIILSPSLEKWENIKTTFHYHLLTPPYKIEDTKNIFLKRFIRKLKEHEGIYIYDLEKNKAIKAPEDRKEFDVVLPERGRIILPEEFIFDLKLYRLAITNDQVNALKIIENLLKDKRIAIVLTADRGRGKSAIVGIGIAGIVKIYNNKGKKLDIGITAPNFSNVQTLFEFLTIGLEKLGLEYEKISQKKIRVGKKIYIEFRRPLDLLSKKYDFVFVDEAAGININMLYKIINKYKKVLFSSTTHGYEGAGRTFSVRFLGYLKSKKNIEVIEYKMREPIRYSENDPIEKWLFDTLLLDAEPAKLNEEDIKCIQLKKVRFYKPDLEKWFESEEEKLRQFVGIYILAHYKNRPNDIAMISDAPHHDARALELETRKIVTALQIAYEGGIPEETIKQMLKKYKPKGNVIPDVIAKHYRSLEFPRLKGIRIVRIATHPEVQGMGLGSIALKELEKMSREEYDWIGAGFGVTYKLLNFWMKNGYVPVHISPERNPVSGEYSVIVLKPLNEKAEKIIKQLNYEFRWRFLNSVTNVFFDIDPETAVLLLKTPYDSKPHFEIPFTERQIKKLKAYKKIKMTYETISDIVHLLALHYFLSSDRPELDEDEEILLFSKVFLAWSFNKISSYFKISKGKARARIHKIIKKYVKFFEERGRI